MYVFYFYSRGNNLTQFGIIRKLFIATHRNDNFKVPIALASQRLLMTTALFWPICQPHV